MSIVQESQLSSNIMTDYASFNVSLDATHSHMGLRLAEIKFDKRWNISVVKEQMEKRFGTAIVDQTLELKNASGDIVCIMSDENVSLDSYGALNGYVIHCIDSNPNAQHGEFDDVSRVEKYVMKDSDYDKKEDTFRNFRKRQIAKDPNWKAYHGQITENE